MELREKIRAALQQKNRYDMISFILCHLSPYTEVLIMYDQDIDNFEIIPMPVGYVLHSDDKRILVHRIKALNSYDDGLEHQQLFTSDETDDIISKYGGDRDAFLNSSDNTGGNLYSRSRSARWDMFVNDWNKNIEEWVSNLSIDQEEI